MLIIQLLYLLAYVKQKYVHLFLHSLNYKLSTVAIYMSNVALRNSNMSSSKSYVFSWVVLWCCCSTGPLLQRELQVPTSSSTPEDAAGDQRPKQPDPAEEHGHARSADADRQCHHAWQSASAHGEKTPSTNASGNIRADWT